MASQAHEQAKKAAEQGGTKPHSDNWNIRQQIHQGWKAGGGQ